MMLRRLRNLKVQGRSEARPKPPGEILKVYNEVAWRKQMRIRFAHGPMRYNKRVWLLDAIEGTDKAPMAVVYCLVPTAEPGEYKRVYDKVPLKDLLPSAQ